MKPDQKRKELLTLSRALRQKLLLEKGLGFDSLTIRPEQAKRVEGSRKEPDVSDQTLPQLSRQVSICTKCRLHQGRTQTVFGEGNPHAALMFVGEAPGREEDLQGRPFVGLAGQLLTRIIESIGLAREEVYIANILKCRPPGNRPPEPDEIRTCEPYLMSQIELIRPKLLCALGKHAATVLVRKEGSISALRGQFSDFHGTPVMTTFHPAYLLRNPSAKRLVWEDMKKAKAYLQTGKFS